MVRVWGVGFRCDGSGLQVSVFNLPSKSMLEPVTASTSQKDRVEGREERAQDILSLPHPTADALNPKL